MTLSLTRSAIYDPYVSKAGNYSIGNPASIYNNLASEQNRVAMSSAENARAAGKGVGDAMKNFFDEAGFEQSLDKWWSKETKRSNGFFTMVLRLE